MGLEMAPITKKYKSIFLTLKEARIKYLWLCFLMLHTFFIPSAVYGYILCLGNDGHVAIELNETDTCCETSLKSSYNERKVIISSDFSVNCCVDTIIEGNNDGFLLSNDNRIIYNLSSILTDFVSEPSLSGQNNPHKSFLFSTPHLNISLLSFSTTISLQI